MRKNLCTRLRTLCSFTCVALLYCISLFVELKHWRVRITDQETSHSKFPIFNYNLNNMMMRKKRYSDFVMPLFVIILGIGNYFRLTGTENIRAIHIVTLLTIGMALGILLRNIFLHFRRKGGDTETIV